MATVFEDKNMSYYAKQTLDFSKMPKPLVDKIVNFYVSIMNEIDNLKRDDLNYDLDDHFNLNDDASSFFNDPYILDGNRIIWKKSDFVQKFEN